MKNTKPNILLDAIHFRQPNDCTLTKKKLHYHALRKSLPII